MAGCQGVALGAVRTAAHVDTGGRRGFHAGARRRHLHHGRRRQGSTLIPAVAGHPTPSDADYNNEQQDESDDAADDSDDEGVVVGDGADTGRFNRPGRWLRIAHPRLGGRWRHRPNNFRLEGCRRSSGCGR